MKWLLGLTLLASPAAAQKAVMEGVNASRYTIKVDTINGRVDVATTSYNWGISNVGLHVASNVVVDSLSAPNACVIYATGSVTCLGVNLGGGGETNTYTSSKTFTSNVLGKSSATFNAFFGDGSHLTGIPSTGSISGVYAPLTGVGTSGTWPINISGNSASASTVAASGVQAGSLGNTVIASSVAATAVTAGNYGTATAAPSFTVAGDGRLTAAGSNTITPAASSITSGTLGNTIIASSVAATAVTAGSYGSASAVPTYTVGGDGRLTAASNTTIAIAEGAVTNLTTDLGLKAPLASPSFTGTVGATGTGASTYSLTLSSGMNFTTTKTGIVWQDGSVSTTAVVKGDTGATGAVGPASTITVRGVVDNFLGSVTGSQTAFTLTQSPASTSVVHVVLDGLVQYNPTDYSLTGTAIAMTTAPASNSQSFYAFYDVYTSTYPGLITSGSSCGGDMSGTFPNCTAVKASGSFTVVSTLTVQGNAFSVGASTFVVLGGNVGIGTASPGAALDVAGGIAMSSGAIGGYGIGTWYPWTLTYTGFSAAPNTTARYMRLGKTVILQLNNTGSMGTSNAAGTSWTFTVPFAANGTQYGVGFGLSCQDNGAFLTAPANGYIGSGNTTLNVYKYDYATAWTATGGKGCFGTFVYEAQ